MKDLRLSEGTRVVYHSNISGYEIMHQKWQLGSQGVHSHYEVGGDDTLMRRPTDLSLWSFLCIVSTLIG